MLASRRWGACVLALAACSGPAPELGPLPAVDGAELGALLAERLEPSIASLRADPRNAEASGRAGMLLQAHEQHELAVEFFERARNIKPGELRWEYYLGVSLEKAGRLDEASAAFRRCASIDPSFLPARRRLAETALGADRVEESLAAFLEIEAQAPDDARVQYGLGRAMAATGDLPSARERLERAVEAAPDYGEAHYTLAMVLRDLGADDESRQHLEQFERNRHGVPPEDDPLLAAVAALRAGAAEYLKRGVEAKEAGREEEAISWHRRALEEDPTLLRARVNLVILFGAAGRFAEAEQQYRLGLESGAESAELHYNYGVLAYDAGRAGEAAAAFREALALNPDHALSHHNLGQTLEEQGRFDDAMAHYRKAIASRPDHGLSHYKIGALLMRQRRAEEAVRSFRLAVREDSDRTPTYLYSLAAAELASGRRELAIRRFGEAREEASRRDQPALIGRIDEALRQVEASGFDPKQ